MRISEVAARSGLSTSTLRYYDSIGLIEAQREPNGYRTYDETVLEQLSFIDEAKQLNLPLPEIAELLGVVSGDTCTRVRDVLHPKLEQRLREVDERLKVLQQLRRRLAEATDRVGACPDYEGSCRTECVLADARSPHVLYGREVLDVT